MIKLLGVKHDQCVKKWKMLCESQCCQPDSVQSPDSINNMQIAIRYPMYILVGDNLDKDVSPRDMRVSHQTKSLHYFHSYAVKDRTNFSACSNEASVIDIKSLPLNLFLPSLNDCKKLRDNYIILVSRVLVNHLNFLSSLKDCVPQHIEHIYSREMAEKSDIVCEIDL